MHRLLIPAKFNLLIITFLVISVYLYKPVVFSLPEFQGLLKHDLLVNSVISFFSDTLLLGICLIILIALHTLGTLTKKVRIFDTLKALTVLFIFLCNAFHIRYIEHFGTTVKPFLFSGITLDGIILKIVFTSPYVLTYVALTLVISYLAYTAIKAFSISLTPAKASTIALFLAAGSQAIFINNRHASGVDVDITQNSFSALVANLKQHRSISLLKKPDSEDLKKLHEIFHIGEVITDRFVGTDYFPLYQSDLEENIMQTAPKDEIYKKLKDFIQEGEAAKGPWNINIVLLETAMSEFINYQNPDAPSNLSPHIDRYLAQSILFNQAYAAGKQTKDGQLATMCSIISLSNYHMLNQSPRLPSTCLGDIFKEKGYDTYFIYPSDNTFDNQLAFYRSHSIDTIIGEKDFEKNLPKSGWGYGDHSLFNKALAVLKDSQKPFFSTILTLSHHHPYVLPSDAPEEISQRKDLSDRLKNFAYMDWSFGTFMDEFSKEHEHTITIFLSDQGTSLEPNSLEESNFHVFQKNLRIPVAIYIPNLPQDLQGVKIERMVSPLDVAPTLGSLLSYKNIKNQFIGKNMFTRNTPIFIREEKNLRKVYGIKSDYRTEKISKQIEDLYVSLFQYNLMLPKFTSEQKQVGVN